jgi:hypothetical protein
MKIVDHVSASSHQAPHCSVQQPIYPREEKWQFFSADTIVIFFYIQWTISITIRLGNFFRWFTKQESLHTFLRRCKFNVFKSLQFNEGKNRNFGTCRTCRLSYFPKERRVGKNTQAESRSTGPQCKCYVYRQHVKWRISSWFIKIRFHEI